MAASEYIVFGILGIMASSGLTTMGLMLRKDWLKKPFDLFFKTYLISMGTVLGFVLADTFSGYKISHYMDSLL